MRHCGLLHSGSERSCKWQKGYLVVDHQDGSVVKGVLRSMRKPSTSAGTFPDQIVSSAVRLRRSGLSEATATHIIDLSHQMVSGGFSFRRLEALDDSGAASKLEALVIHETDDLYIDFCVVERWRPSSP